MKRIMSSSTGRRILNAGFAFVVALSTVTAGTPFLFAKSAAAVPFGQTVLRLSSAEPTAINAGETTSFSVKDVTGLGGDGWTNTLTGALLNATIKATVTKGKIARTCNAPANQWGTTATATIGAGFKVVEAGFCYKGEVTGNESIQLAAHVNRLANDIDDSLTVPVTVNSVGTPVHLLPASGTFTNEGGFTMSWNKVANATKYEYQTSHTKVNEATLGQIIYADNSSAGNYGVSGNTITRGNSGTPDAEYYWQVRAGDDYGNWSDWSAISLVTVDKTKPTKPVLALPSNGSYVKTNDFDFDWNDSTDATQLTYEFQSSQDPSRDSNQVLNGNGIWKSGVLPTSMIHSSGAPDGWWFYQVRAKDAAGNYSDWSDIWAVNLDTIAPALTFTGQTPAANAFVKGTVSLQTIVSDQNPGPLNVRVEDGAPAPLSLGLSYVFSPTSGAVNSYDWNTKSGAKAVADGTHTVLATTTDKAGNKTTITRTLTVDNTKPVVMLTSPAASSFNPSTIQVSATDNLALNKVTANIYDEANSVLKKPCSQTATPDGSTSYTLTCVISGLGDGVYTIRTNASDKAGNVASTLTRQFTIDTTAPSAPVLGLRANATDLVSGGFTNAFTVTALWNTPSADTVSYDYKYWNDIAASAYNGEANAWFNNGLTVTQSTGVFNQGEGTHYMQVRAIDAAGNASAWSNTFEIIYDVTPPVVTLTGYQANGAVITPELSATDANGPLTYAWVGSNAGVTVSDTSELMPTFTVTQDGTYVYTLTVTDAAGNKTEKDFSFTYTAPVVVTPLSQPASLVATQTVSNVQTGSNAFSNVAVTDPTNDNPDTATVQGARIGNTTDTDDEAVLGTTAEPTQKAGEFAPLGLSWYWWLPIVVAGGGAAWWLLALMRRSGEE